MPDSCNPLTASPALVSVPLAVDSFPASTDSTCRSQFGGRCWTTFGTLVMLEKRVTEISVAILSQYLCPYLFLQVLQLESDIGRNTVGI